MYCEDYYFETPSLLGVIDNDADGQIESGGAPDQITAISRLVNDMNESGSYYAIPESRIGDNGCVKGDAGKMFASEFNFPLSDRVKQRLEKNSEKTVI